MLSTMLIFKTILRECELYVRVCVVGGGEGEDVGESESGERSVMISFMILYMITDVIYDIMYHI